MSRPSFVLLSLLLCACSSKSAGPATTIASSSETPERIDAGVAEPADPNGVFTPALAVIGQRKLYVEAFDSLLLFGDERVQAEQIIADWARQVGFSIIDPEQVQQAIARGAAGQDLATGKACGPSLSPSWAKNRWLPTLGSAGYLEASVYCSPDCVLQLSVRLDRQGTEFFAAPFDPSKPWHEELHTRLRQLSDNGGHGEHGHLNNPVETSGIKHEASTHDWFLDDADLSEMPASMAALAPSCGVDLRDLTLLVEAQHGTLRCEAVNIPNYDNDRRPELAACLCKELSAQPDSPRHLLGLSALRRLDPPRTTKNGRELSANLWVEGRYSEEPWTERSFFSDCEDASGCEAVASCFVDRKDPLDSVGLNVTIYFDAQGTASSATIADLAQVLSADEHACLSKKLMTARIPCPDTATSTRTGRLALWIGDK